jgi:hypothetical protein
MTYTLLHKKGVRYWANAFPIRLDVPHTSNAKYSGQFSLKRQASTGTYSGVGDGLGEVPFTVGDGVCKVSSAAGDIAAPDVFA